MWVAFYQLFKLKFLVAVWDHWVKKEAEGRGEEGGNKTTIEYMKLSDL